MDGRNKSREVELGCRICDTSVILSKDRCAGTFGDAKFSSCRTNHCRQLQPSYQTDSESSTEPDKKGVTRHAETLLTRMPPMQSWKPAMPFCNQLICRCHRRTVRQTCGIIQIPRPRRISAPVSRSPSSGEYQPRAQDDQCDSADSPPRETTCSHG